MTVTVDDDGPLLRSVLRLPGCSPERALAAFTSPQLLAGWWGNAELTVELVPGGSYDVWFAGIPARMTGQVISYAPGSLLEFSWAWDHLLDLPASTVAVLAGPADDGAILTIEHGPHADDEAGRAARRDHREGWEHFLPRLETLLAA